MQQPVLQISIKKLYHNIQLFKEHTTAKLCAVVKADAYGHGATSIAQYIEQFIDFFAVATVQEGVQLRLAGIKKEILVFIPATSMQEVLKLLHYQLTASITDLQDFILLQTVAMAENNILTAHIKVNTGMNRYGFNMQSFKAFCNLRFVENVQIEGIYSHFYCARQPARTERQFAKFIQFAAVAENTFGKLTKHIAATGAFFVHKKYHLDAVRLGLGLYGYLPDEQAITDLTPIMQLDVPVVATTQYVGGGVGYSLYKPKVSKLATVRMGYADGLFCNKLAKISPCMDSQIIEGQYLKYEQLNNFIDFKRYAKEHKSSIYKVLTSFGNRVERQYIFDIGQD